MATSPLHNQPSLRYCLFRTSEWADGLASLEKGTSSSPSSPSTPLIRPTHHRTLQLCRRPVLPLAVPALLGAFLDYESIVVVFLEVIPTMQLAARGTLEELAHRDQVPP
ncbi:uncharacterized protein PG998_001317 [Apiospora kogelbergensis]|uniref:uncharacterized protein n=1 Tax=Apiospora kogelbergensis TaxID=1337665 RepID=UPI00313222C4